MQSARRYVWLVVISFMAIVAVSLRAGQIRDLPDLKMVDHAGQSSLYQSGKVRVLLLQGTPYQIGYAHGKLMAKDVTRLIDRFLLVCRAADNAKQGDFFAASIEQVYQRTLPYIPARYREELKGLADGAGLDFHQVELANLFPELFHCSGFAFMGKATKDGKLIHGRILDYMTEIGIQDHAVVAVIKSPGVHTILLPTYAGFIGCVTGMNDRQISIGEMGMGGEGNWDGMPMSYMLRQILEESDNLPTIRDYFVRTRKTCEYAYVVSDGKAPNALGVHARFDGVEFLEPGQANPLLPSPLADCIMMSAGDRYKYLAQKAKETYGKIDLASTVELIKRPLAMNSNLHDAIMIPADKVMYLADAVNPDQKNFQACYQPYYKHDLNKYARMLESQAKQYEPSRPATVVLPTTTQPTSTKPDAKVLTVIEGKIPAALHRPIKSATDPKLAALLKRFDVPAADVPFQMKLKNRLDKYDLWQVTFPSPFTSADPENNTVWCEYFQAKRANSRPAVIVLHILQNDFTLPRVICHLLASNGLDALLVKMAYYGERRPRDPARQKELMGNVDFLVNGVTQSVMDIRRAAEFLATQPSVDKNKIGICGVSFGALVGSLTIGVDGHFPRSAFILGGGNLVKIIEAHSHEVHELNDYMRTNNISSEKLAQLLEPIEPLTYIDRAADGQSLLVNARADKVIPTECTQGLAARLPRAKVVWYDADHTSMLWYLVDMVNKVQVFFTE